MSEESLAAYISLFKKQDSEANIIVSELEQKLQKLKNQYRQQTIMCLQEENAKLRNEVQNKLKLVAEICPAVNISNNICNISAPEQNGNVSTPVEESKPAEYVKPKPSKPIEAEKPKEPSADKTKKADKSEGKPKKEKGKKPEPAPATPIDVGRLDFRVGKILSVKKHPDADSLYIEEVDVAEDKPRQVVSGLVRFLKPEELDGQMVVLLCNLKPAAMRGVTSYAMVMCASTPDKVEFLRPPEGSVPGDIVEFEGYERNPDAVLNPKKKIFEACAPDLKTSDSGMATYKGVPFTVKDKGVVKSSTLFEVQIK